MKKRYVCDNCKKVHKDETMVKVLGSNGLMYLCGKCYKELFKKT